MFMIKVNKCRVRTSVSVLAMVFSASMALADVEEATADVEGDTAMSVPEVISCEMFPGPVEPVDAPEDLVKLEEPVVTIVTVDGGEEVLVTLTGVSVEDGGEDPLMYYTSVQGGPEFDMVKRNPASVAVRADRLSQARDPAAVPNLCDVAGPGLDWLCGAKAR
jgi:hypothetical protein